MQNTLSSAKFYDGSPDDSLFARIAADIELQGFSIRYGEMPARLTAALWHHQNQMEDRKYHLAGVGRTGDLLYNDNIRSDESCWITGETLAGRQWLKWSAELQQYLNRRLFLGLFSFESHFAHYAPGAFYCRHRDAFAGQANRVLSVVVYLNKDWAETDGGELVLYSNDDDTDGLKVLPKWGTIVTFLSEEFPHEVLPAKRDRYSVAGWYRINTSTSDRIEPSR
jgi:SM-20-related protein